MADAGIKITFDTKLTPPNLAEKLSHAETIYKKVLEEYFKALNKAAIEGGEKRILERKAVDKGTLKKSLSKSSATSKGFFYGSNLSYAGYVDNPQRWGVKFSWPDVTSLRDWVNRHLSPSPRDLKHVSFLVGEKLSVRGPKNGPVDFIKAAEDNVKEHLDSAGESLIKSILSKIS